SKSFAKTRKRREALAGSVKFAKRLLTKDSAALPSTDSITSPARRPDRSAAELRSTLITVGNPAISATAKPTLTKRGRHQSNFSSGEKTRVCGSFKEAIIRRSTAYSSWLEPAFAASARKVVLCASQSRP